MHDAFSLNLILNRELIYEVNRSLGNGEWRMGVWEFWHVNWVASENTQTPKFQIFPGQMGMPIPDEMGFGNFFLSLKILSSSIY